MQTVLFIIYTMLGFVAALAAIMVFLAICAMAMVIVLPFIINQQ